jgi:hypothetical protein
MHFLQGNTSVLWERRSTVQLVVSKLAELGYDAADMIDRQPTMVNYRPAKLEAAHKALIKHGKDPLVVATNDPALLVHNGSRTPNEQYNNRSPSADSAQLLSRYCLDELGMSHRKLASGIEQLGRVPASEKLSEVIAAVGDHDLNAGAIFGNNFRLFSRTPAYIARRVRAIERFCRILDWPGEPQELINSDHHLLASSDAKLMVHARLFARFGRRDMSASEIAAYVKWPLESHLITLSLGKPYTALNLEKTNHLFPAAERKELVKALFEQRELLAATVGDKTVRAYERYATRKTPAPRTARGLRRA